MKKKILLLIFACLILLAGCGKENSENDNNYSIETEYDENVVLDTEEKIYDYAKELIDREITVRINGPETTISIGYEGRHEQVAIDYAFSAIKNGLKETAYEDYYLSIGGMDGQPLQYDKIEHEEYFPPVPETVPYNHVGYIGADNAPVFEIVSTTAVHETKSEEVINILKENMLEESWFFYIVDENEKFLGKGSKDGYTPFVFSTLESEQDTSSCEIPFKYYLSKYFNGIEYNGYNARSYKNREYGYKQYEFVINEVSKDSYEQVKEAVESIFDALKATIGSEQATVTIIVYPDKEYEIKMRSYDPDIDGDDENKALDWLNSKTK